MQYKTTNVAYTQVYAKSLLDDALVTLGITDPTEKPTYAKLATAVSTGSNVRRNTSVLNEWMDWRKKTDADPICLPLASACPVAWGEAHDQFMAHSTSGASEGTKYNKRSALKAIRTEAVQLAITVTGETPPDLDRWNLLRNHVRANQDTLFPDGVPQSMKSWLDGRSHIFLSRNKFLRLLEQRLGIKEGTLLSYRREPQPEKTIDLAGTKPTGWRRNKLEHDLPEHIKEVVNEYNQYKLDLAPELRRSTMWTRNHKGVCHSQRTFHQALRHIYNFAIRPPTTLDDPQHGFGLHPQRVEFIDLFRADLNIQFIRWQVNQIGKPIQSTVTTYLHPLYCLLHPDNGWITQQPERFGEQLRKNRPNDPIFKGNDWVEQFDKWRQKQRVDLKGFEKSLPLKTVAARNEKSRDPFERIALILKQDNPLDECFRLLTAMEKFQKDHRLTEEGKLRNEIGIFWVAALMALPLRVSTWTAMVLNKHLYRKNGQWHVSIDRELFKNRRFMPQKEYEVTLGDFVTPYIDHYVNNVRPKLYGATLGSPFVFCSENKFSPYGRGPVGEQYLQHLIRRVTERHWGVDVGPHAWRHIVATQILKTDPRNIAGAAAVLNDAESTIRRHYGHLMPNDAFKSFTELADRMANERKKGGG